MNTGAGIANRNLQVGVDSIQTDVYFTTGWCELDSVGHEIPNNLLQPFAISHHHSEILRQRNVQFHTFGVSGGPKTLGRSLNHWLQFASDEIESKFSSDNA